MISEDLSFALESSRLFAFDNGPRRHCKNDLVAKSWNIVIAHREPDEAAMVAKPRASLFCCFAKLSSQSLLPKSASSGNHARIQFPLQPARASQQSSVSSSDQQSLCTVP